MRALLLGALAVLSLAGGAAAQQQQYCDGSGGLQTAERDYSDPSCAGYCHGCSAAQVLAAMAAAPDDGIVQNYGLIALGTLAYRSPANRAAIADAGGIEAVTGSMARFPDVRNVQQYGRSALALLAEGRPEYVAGDYCDGAGGITHTDPGGRSDPTCRSSCDYYCSAEQVLAAMAAAPDDGDVQRHGCLALGWLAAISLE